MNFKEEKKPNFKDDKAMKDNPNAAMMNMMKKLYDEGDDDMKRMMNKAWSEN